MTLDWDDRREDAISAADGENLRLLAQRLIATVLEADRLTGHVNVSVSLVGGPEIREINRMFRGIDAETDVLSFPVVDYDIAGEARMGDVDLTSGELMLGDIVVSVDRAREQAAEYGHSFDREFAYLITHGMLHLIGYDHTGEGDTLVMREMEEKVLDKLSLSR